MLDLHSSGLQEIIEVVQKNNETLKNVKQSIEKFIRDHLLTSKTHKKNCCLSGNNMYKLCINEIKNFRLKRIVDLEHSSYETTYITLIYSILNSNKILSKEYTSVGVYNDGKTEHCYFNALICSLPRDLFNSFFDVLLAEVINEEQKNCILSFKSMFYENVHQHKERLGYVPLYIIKSYNIILELMDILNIFDFKTMKEVYRSELKISNKIPTMFSHYGGNKDRLLFLFVDSILYAAKTRNCFNKEIKNNFLNTFVAIKSNGDIEEAVKKQFFINQKTKNINQSILVLIDKKQQEIPFYIDVNRGEEKIRFTLYSCIIRSSSHSISMVRENKLRWKIISNNKSFYLDVESDNVMGYSNNFIFCINDFFNTLFENMEAVCYRIE